MSGPDTHAAANPPLGQGFPSIRATGFDGFLVSFADRLSEPANRAALAFRAALDAAQWDGVEESSTSLVSAYLRFDPLRRSHQDMRSALQALLLSRDWLAAELPRGRRLWRVPAVFGGAAGPQLEEAARLAGLSAEDAIASLSGARVRVQTIGFAPGMPYMGELPAAWDIPRQTALSPQVPAAALCVAIRQLVLFPVDTPTGWRHVGQTGFRLFRPEAEQPFLLAPGDEVRFVPTDAAHLAALQADPQGGATSEAIP